MATHHIQTDIPYTSYVAPDGVLSGEMPEATPDPQSVVPLYRAMVRARTFDARAVAMHRTGRLGTYSSILGQEAVGVGIASAMAPDDVLVPSYREIAAQLVRGVTPVELLLYWGGDERGNDFAVPRRDFPNCITVGEHPTHAAGVALAMKLRREPRVAVCTLGDGGSSKGAFYEALNMAGVMTLPLVVVVINNQWAISAPRSIQSAAPTLAHKALGVGIRGEQVDGNDVVAVTDVTLRAIERARAGEGATLIEAVTYRLGDHTTVDDARRYRDDTEVSEAWQREPIGRIRTYLADAGVWTKPDEEELRSTTSSEVDSAAEEYLAIEPLPTEAMFDYVWATMPPEFARQRMQAALDWGRDA
jgi:2-oxoisovalerate dehydrogenase E1 component alpha subunit